MQANAIVFRCDESGCASEVTSLSLDQDAAHMALLNAGWTMERVGLAILGPVSLRHRCRRHSLSSAAKAATSDRDES